jgi:hypothetical protein
VGGAGVSEWRWVKGWQAGWPSCLGLPTGYLTSSGPDFLGRKRAWCTEGEGSQLLARESCPEECGCGVRDGREALSLARGLFVCFFTICPQALGQSLHPCSLISSYNKPSIERTRERLFWASGLPGRELFWLRMYLPLSPPLASVFSGVSLQIHLFIVYLKRGNFPKGMLKL